MFREFSIIRSVYLHVVLILVMRGAVPVLFHTPQRHVV